MELDFTARRNLLCGRRNRDTCRVLRLHQDLTGGIAEFSIQFGCYLDSHFFDTLVGICHAQSRYCRTQAISGFYNRNLIVPVIFHCPSNL